MKTTARYSNYLCDIGLGEAIPMVLGVMATTPWCGLPANLRQHLIYIRVVIWGMATWRLNS